MKILMVCLGNICRSPMAEGILSKMAREANLAWTIHSAGTGSWHVGEPPDRRAIAICRQKDLDISHQQARQIRSRDLDEYDLILAMDDVNYRDLLAMARSSEQRARIRTLASYGNTEFTSVPDPYYDGSFSEVYTILETLCAHVVAAHQNGRS